MVRGGGGRDPGGRVLAAAAPGIQRLRRLRRPRRGPGDRRGAGAVGTAAMAKGLAERPRAASAVRE